MSSAVASMFAEALAGEAEATPRRLSLLEYAKYQCPSYRPAAHQRLIADKLEAVERGDIKRLAIFMPPRHGKSMFASEDFPAWYLGRNPTHHVISATYSQQLADDFGRKVRNQLRSEEFDEIFPGVGLRGDSHSVRRFHTAQGGVYYGAGIGGPITGRGAHLLLIDDPVKSRTDASSPTRRQQTWDWYTSVAYTRLMPGAAIVLIQTRWDPDDLAGRVLRHAADEGWEVLSLPAIDAHGAALWPEAYPIERLEEIRRQIGPRDWSALYQQEPAARDGGVFKAEPIDTATGRVGWCETLADAIPDAAERKHAVVCTGVDLATRKGEEHDLTVFTTLLKQGHRYRILNVRAKRIEATAILSELLDVYRCFHAGAGKARFRVEDNAAQTYIVQMAKDAKQMAALGATEAELSRLVVTGHTTTIKKRDLEIGVPSIASDLEMDRVEIPRHRETDALREEMLSWAPDVHTGDRLMSLWIARAGVMTPPAGIRLL